MNEPRWLVWARQLQAIAQTGRHFTHDPFDRERYEQLESLASEIVAHHTNEIPQEQITGIFHTEDGYATPKIDVRGVVFNKQGKILLVRENIDEGRWTLPGGWADVNVRPSENAEREVLEESGYVVKATRLLAFLDRRLHGHPPHMFHCYKLYFLCDLLQDEPIISPQGDLESSESGWFSEASLPSDDEISVGRVTRKLLLNFFEQYRHPDGATQFD